MWIGDLGKGTLPGVVYASDRGSDPHLLLS
jgi:hypothetical protein